MPVFLCSSRLRDEKLTLQKQHQEERIKKATERAQAEIKQVVRQMPNYLDIV